MGRQHKWGGAVLLLLGVCPLGIAQSNQNEKQADGRIAKLFRKAQPHLEAVLQCRLNPAPTFRIISNEMMRLIPDRDAEAQLRLRYGYFDGVKWLQALHTTRSLAGSAAVARLWEPNQQIYVAPDQLELIAKWDETLHRANSPELLQLILVHEAARLHLHQQFDLMKRRSQCQDREELQAFQAITEGYAQWVTYQVAKRLGTDGMFRLLAERFLRIPDVSVDPAMRAVSQTTIRKRHWAYTKGKAFYQQLKDRQINDLENKMFTRPPRLAKWIDDPDLYIRALNTNRPDLGQAMRQLEAALSTKEWKMFQQPWTQDMVRQVAGLVGEKKRAERILTDWEEGRSLLWMHQRRSQKIIAVSVVRYQSAEAASKYYGFAIDVQRKRDKQSNDVGSVGIRVADTQSRAVNIRGAAEAIRFDKKIEMPNSSDKVSSTTILARKGDQVIEITWHDAAPDVQWAQQIVAKLP